MNTRPPTSAMILETFTLATPVGPFSCALDTTGAVAATAFGPSSTLRGRLSSCHLMDDIESEASVRVRGLVEEYFAGTRSDFDVRLSAHGTEFQRRVWAELQEIPAGETRTYREIATAIGNPGACRAVGRANATNPICLFVPCHRVIGADGSLTGFAFGETIKAWLIDHERAMAAEPQTSTRASARWRRDAGQRRNA